LLLVDHLTALEDECARILNDISRGRMLAKLKVRLGLVAKAQEERQSCICLSLERPQHTRGSFICFERFIRKAW
jgi:hypothetical protein